MMLSMSFGLAAEAAAIERAVEQALATDARTKDIARGGPWVSGRKMTDIILGNVG